MSKIWVLGFSWLGLVTSLRVEAPVMRFTQNVRRLPLWLTHEWTFQLWKTPRQIFKILSHGFSATCTGDLFVTHSSREKCVFCTLRVIVRVLFQNLFIFPSHIVNGHCLPLPNSPCSFSKTLFSSSSLHQSSRKCIGSLFFSKYFMCLAFDFLDFVFFVEFRKYDVEYRFWIFGWVWWMDFVSFC